MKKIGGIILLSILLMITTKIVIGVGNGTPFYPYENEKIDAKMMSVSGEVIISGDDQFISDAQYDIIYSGEISGQEEIETKLNEIVKTNKDKNIMLFGKELDITGEAKDLIMAAGANITSKALGSYAFMTASQLDISGEIFNDTFAVGNNIKVEGDIGRDLYVLGNTINITGTVERDVYVGGESLMITGRINGNVKFAGDSIYISSNAVIDGDIDLSANSVVIENEATINGTVTYNSNVENISIPQNIRTHINQIKKTEKPEENKMIATIKDFIWWSISNFILFVVAITICPSVFEKIRLIYSSDAAQKYCSSCGWGLLSILIIPILSILSLFTFIGSALGVIGLLIYAVIYMISTILVAYAFSNTFIEKDMNNYLKGFIGIIVIEVLRRLPVIGGIVAIIVNAIAFGTVLKLIKISNSKKEEKIKSEEE